MGFKRFIKKTASLTPKWLFNFYLQLFRKKRVNDSCDDYDLGCSYPDNGKSCIKSKPSKITDEYDLQIVVPCYNISKYGERCIESIVNQKTNYSIYVVLINDGSTDNTAEILEKYKSKNVEIINKKNGGPSSARNRGLEVVRSKYLMFVDSDDYLVDESVIDNAIKQLKSIQFGDNKIVLQFLHANASTRNKQLKSASIKQVEPSYMTGFAWGKIFSSELFSEIEFPENYWFEDTILHSIIYPMADVFYQSNLILYFYQLNEMGITSQSKNSPKILDTFYVTKTLLLDCEKLHLKRTLFFHKRFYLQAICNSVRLLPFDYKVRQKVFAETKVLFEQFSIPKINEFKMLYLSFVENNFSQYEQFCSLYSKLYLNVD